MLLFLSLCGGFLFAYHTPFIWVLKNKAIATKYFREFGNIECKLHSHQPSGKKVPLKCIYLGTEII